MGSWNTPSAIADPDHSPYENTEVFLKSAHMPAQFTNMLTSCHMSPQSGGMYRRRARPSGEQRVSTEHLPDVSGGDDTGVATAGHFRHRISTV